MEFPNLKEAGASTPAIGWDIHPIAGRKSRFQVAWVNPDSDTYTHVISDLSLEETLKVIRSLR